MELRRKRSFGCSVPFWQLHEISQSVFFFYVTVSMHHANAKTIRVNETSIQKFSATSQIRTKLW